MCFLKHSNDIRPNKRFSCSTMNSYSLIIFAEICRHLIFADIPYICSRTSLAQFEGRSTNFITKRGRTKPAGGDAQLPGQLRAALSVAALCTWDQERNSNRKGGKSNRRWTKTEVEERERGGETLKCAASVCRKLKLARATDASRRCTLQAEQVEGEYMHTCVWDGWRMNGVGWEPQQPPLASTARGQRVLSSCSIVPKTKNNSRNQVKLN